MPQHASSTRSPGRTACVDRDPPPALVEPDGHHAVHRVVDRRDPVEHPLHAARRGSRPVSTVTAVPSAASGRSRGRAGRGARDDEVDEVVDRLRAVVEAGREEEDRRRRPRAA